MKRITAADIREALRLTPDDAAILIIDDAGKRIHSALIVVRDVRIELKEKSSI